MPDQASSVAAPWEFWIDVGGTFTDCFARGPQGQLSRYKLLSTGMVTGRVGPGSSGRTIIDGARRADPPQVWEGFAVRLRRDARIVAEGRVLEFDQARGALVLDVDLPDDAGDGLVYELSSGEEAPLVAVRYLLGLRRDQPIGAVSIRLGTTRGTNALLTRRGARTALVTTRGFGDILKIGYQNRPRLFDLDIVKTAPLFSAVLEIDERVAVDGAVLKAPDEDTLAAQFKELKRQGIESLAICLLHASDHPQHEALAAQAARRAGFTEISVSHQAAPLVKIVARGDTTVVDAYLNPVLRQYVGRLQSALGAGSRLRLMTSAGGLVGADHFTGKDSVLSGPAGGVVGFSQVALAAGFARAIGFDMGGTSTDVSRFDGGFEFEYETEKAGVRLVTPILKIHTVAAGGGSICRFDGVKLVVGPESAGADPGPACYGRGGPLCITDLNYYLGRLPARRFPLPLDRAAVELRLAELIAAVRAESGREYTPQALCEGLLEIANQNMVQAIRAISIAQGADPRDYVLASFGGAGGQHATAVARELGMRQVLCHPDAGLLSAYGIGLADVTRHKVAGVYQPWDEQLASRLANVFDELARSAREELQNEGVPAERIEISRSLEMRYRGLDAALAIAAPADGDYAAAFEREHQKLYGYLHQQRPLEVVSARIAAQGRVSAELPQSKRLAARDAVGGESVAVWHAGQELTARQYDRADLTPGCVLTGPAIVCEPTSTLWIEPGWRAEALSGGELLLTGDAVQNAAATSTTADPVMLEVFNNQFAGIAEQMGITLRNTASSVNVKERLDFSCALFNAAGHLIVNAPHIPVHLGAMGLTVRSVLADNPRMAPGDVFVTNDPYRGGSHLPDVTVVTPVHDPPTGRLLFFTASRAHHAEIGGIVPGSMPPFSKNLAEEGVLIRNLRVVAAGQSRMEALEALLSAGPHPSRAVTDNLADIAAQIAANQQGARDLARLVERYTLPVVEAYMEHIQDAAERKLRQALARLPLGRREFVDHLDGGERIAVAITIEHQPAPRAIIDFTGTSGVSAGNLNANRAIVTAATLYVLRVLIAENIPLNEGVLSPVTLILPESILNPAPGATPATSPAVVGGNVETSQRVVDVLLGALGLAAASQGTMNNLLFGDATFGYYETICGGAGATSQRAGADAVHTHMTNTRLTDPEVLERRAPVRLRRFAIRPGSGGAGHQRGGEGVIREIEFLKPLAVSILSQRRGPYPPYGAAGGEPGRLGSNTLRRANGQVETLSYQAQLSVNAGDVLTIETPGGGGWGAPENELRSSQPNEAV
jgi:5-oxoprolinase (ATP-hydrolysing)